MGKKRGNREQRYNFNSDEEFWLYKNVCGLIKEKEKRKLTDEQQKVNTYFKWKNYIICRYRVYDREHLESFYRYLKFRKRSTQGINNWWKGFSIPFFIAIVAAFSLNIINDTEKLFSKIGTDPILKIISTEVEIKTKCIVLLGILIVGLVLMIPIIILTAGLGAFMWNTLKVSISTEQEEAFYEDYIEIILGLLEEKYTREKRGEPDGINAETENICR